MESSFEKEEKKEEIKEEKALEKRENKIISWLKQPSNATLMIILLVALILRLIIFHITQSQALWWDEADYMIKAKAVAFDTPTTGWNSGREIVAPYIWGFFLMIAQSEFLPRLLQVIVSLGTVFLVYLFGKEVFNERVGLIASAITAANAMFLFYTGRLLTYMWAPFFFILIFYFFWRGYYKKEKIYVYLAPIMGALGIAVYSSVLFGLIALLLFLILTEGIMFLKRKEIWIMAIVGIIASLPNFIYFYITKGDAFIRWHALEKTMMAADWSFFAGYFKLFPHLFGVLFTFLIVIAFFFVLFRIGISIDLAYKSKQEDKKARLPQLFLVLWVIVVFGFYIFNAIKTKTVWESFIFPAFPALFIMVGIFFNSLYKFGNNKTSKSIITGIIIVVIFLGVYGQAISGINMANSSANSYFQIKEAGDWLKLNTPENATIYTTSMPQITYYSERNSIRIPDTLEEFELMNISENSYYQVSVFERTTHTWTYQYPQDKNLTAVAVFFLDEAKKQPAVIIYRLK